MGELIFMIGSVLGDEVVIFSLIEVVFRFLINGIICVYSFLFFFVGIIFFGVWINKFLFILVFKVVKC